MGHAWNKYTFFVYTTGRELKHRGPYRKKKVKIIETVTGDGSYSINVHENGSRAD